MMPSGRHLTAEGEVVRQWRLGRFRAAVLEQDRHIAHVESEWVAFARSTLTRHSTITFIDGARWSISTGPPTWTPVERRILGATRPGLPRLEDRVATVEDEEGHLLAEATWPNPALQRVQIRFGEATHWLDYPSASSPAWRLGELLTVTPRRRRTVLTPEGSVPMEAALLCWHVAVGDSRIVTVTAGGS